MNASSHGNARYENSGGVSHENVGAYALGLLTPGECDAFEAHLAGCDRCGEELEQLMAIAEVMPAAEPPMLSVDSERFVAQVAEPAPRRDTTDVSASTSAASALGTAGPAPSAAPAAAVPAAVAKPARTRRLFALAAGFVLLAVGALGGVVGNQWTSDEPARPPGNEVAQGLGPGERITAVDAATGLEATAALTTKGWGTNVVLRLSKLRGPLTCALVAVKQDGTRETAMTWAVPPKGYGTPEQPDPLLLSGGSSIPRDQLDRFEVRDSTGRVLVTLPA